MKDSEALVKMIQEGGVYYNICGETPQEVFADVVTQLSLPPTVSPEVLLSGLLEREGLMTTSIGDGIALPHPRTPLVFSEAEERIFVCFLDRPINFDAMDGKQVYVLFIIISSGSSSHLKILSRLSFLFQKESFRHVLQGKPNTEELITAIAEYL